MKPRKGCLIRRGKIYYACWYVGPRKFVKTTGQTTREDAEKVLARFVAPLVSQDEAMTLEMVKAGIEHAKTQASPEASRPPLLLTDAWRAYQEDATRPDSGDRTLADYGRYFAAFLRWLPLHHPQVLSMGDVSGAVAQDYVQHLNSRRLSPCAFNKNVNALALVFRVLGRHAGMGENPWASITRKRLTTQARRELTMEELTRVCSTARGEMRLLFALGIYTGMRLGDCATLRWSEVDLVRERIVRVPNKTARRNDKPVSIPIHTVLRGMLGSVERSARTEYVLPETAILYRTDNARLSKQIQAHFRANGIRTARPGTGRGEREHPHEALRAGSTRKGRAEVPLSRRAVLEVGFHSLRHTFVSLCREANAPLAVVESIVGHANPSMTRHYTHVSERAAGAAVSLLPAVLGDPAPTHKPATPAAVVDTGTMREILRSMTAENWADKRDALLAMLPG